jgi:hypothetical protein
MTTNKQNYRTIVQRDFRGELSNPIQFASGAKPGVKTKISKTKTEVETKERKKNTKKTSVLHGSHSLISLIFRKHNNQWIVDRY